MSEKQPRENCKRKFRWSRSQIRLIGNPDGYLYYRSDDESFSWNFPGLTSLQYRPFCKALITILSSGVRYEMTPVTLHVKYYFIFKLIIYMCLLYLKKNKKTCRLSYLIYIFNHEISESLIRGMEIASRK